METHLKSTCDIVIRDYPLKPDIGYATTCGTFFVYQLLIDKAVRPESHEVVYYHLYRQRTRPESHEVVYYHLYRQRTRP